MMPQHYYGEQIRELSKPDYTALKLGSISMSISTQKAG